MLIRCNSGRLKKSFFLIPEVVGTSWTVPEMCWFCRYNFPLPQVQFDNGHLRVQFWPNYEAPYKFWKWSPCLVLGSPHPWRCHWYALFLFTQSLSSSLFSLWHTTGDALVTPTGCTSHRCSVWLSVPVSLWPCIGRGILLTLQNIGCASSISFTWAL